MTESARNRGFGIDFGTTNSVVAAAIGREAPKPLLSGGRTHPSVVWYGPEAIVVGLDAKSNFNAYADQAGHRFVRSVKRQLGRGKSLETTAGRRQPAWEVAAEVFRHLRRRAEVEHRHTIDEAVISVPIDFDGPRRADIRKAAQAAGIHVTAMVHEPFAAVVGYYRSIGMNLGALPTETILVFDWGGGTLDMTIVRSDAGTLEELATGGLADVAGDRFDEYLQKRSISMFLERNQLGPEQFQPTRPALDRLAAEAERAKIELSARETTTVGVAKVAELRGTIMDMKEQVSRAEFDTLIAPDIEIAFYQIDQMLSETRIAADEIDKVLLVGGTSEIPLLRKNMARMFGVRAQPVRSSQTIIAEGAAEIARRGFEPYLAAPVQIQLSDESVHTVFPHGMRVPDEAGKNMTLFCTDNRDGEARLVLRIGTGARDGGSRQRDILAVPVISDLPRPYQHERVHAAFQVDQDLVLQVEAHGAAKSEVVRSAIHDLKFGLRMR